MSIPTILIVVALALAAVEEFGAQGRSLLGWAVVLLCVALLGRNIRQEHPRPATGRIRLRVARRSVVTPKSDIIG